MAAISTAYCTIDDVANRISKDGIFARIDDVPPDAYGDCIDEASRMIDEYCYLQYGSNLALSNVVKHWTANIATYLLCTRRGNPAPVGIVHDRYERAMKTLEAVLHNGRQIPDIAQLKSAVPVMSNVHIQPWPYPHTVVEGSTRRSTGTAAGYRRNTDTLDAPIYDYSI